MNTVELEAMSNKTFRVELVRPKGVQQHWRAHSVDQPRGDRDVAIPETLQMQIHFRSVNADVGEMTPGSDELLAQLERLRDTDRLNSRVHPAPFRHLHNPFQGLAVRAIDHYGLRRREELGRKQGRKPNRACANDGHGGPRLDLTVEYAALEAGRKDVA